MSEIVSHPGGVEGAVFVAGASASPNIDAIEPTYRLPYNKKVSGDIEIIV